MSYFIEWSNLVNNNIKAIALYLPQFHQVPENDLWWGKGFTEWTAVQKAVSLFKGHQQPKKPLNDNYYNLLDRKTMQWQADLAKKYAISGFCFYHYWFKDGQKILEKPAENLLKWKDIDMEFCFSWANETWARSWENVVGQNIWANTFEPPKNGNNGILLEQKYGEERAWREHFEYLLPFFRDPRYIKINEKPLFLIHRTDLMPCMERMLFYWRELAVEFGLPGLYIIGTNIVEYTTAVDATMHNMSRNIGALSKCIEGTKVHGVPYDVLWKSYLDTRPLKKMKNFWCGMVNYDDTPRRGMEGTAYLGVSIDKFKRYYDLLVQKSIREQNPFVFINAWNEWGEGMYLEPDTSNGYGYLEAVQEVMDQYKAIIYTETMDSDEETKVIQKDSIDDLTINLVKRVHKFKQNYELLHRWMLLKEKSISLESYFLKYNYQNIAVYGLGLNGQHLCLELSQSKIQIKYIIDSRKASLQAKEPIYDLSDNLPVCDVVIITVINEYTEIANNLRKKINCPIISLSEVVFECS